MLGSRARLHNYGTGYKIKADCVSLPDVVATFDSTT